MKFHIVCFLPMNREEFWKVRSSNEFLRFLCNEKKSNFEKIEIEEEWMDSDGTGHRRVRYTPRMEFFELAKMARKYVEKFFTGFEDVQTWNDISAPFCQVFINRPLGKLEDRVVTRGQVTVEPAGEEQCKHVMVGDCTANIMGIGTLIESAVVANMEKFYKYTYPTVVARYKKYKDSLAYSCNSQGLNDLKATPQVSTAA
ncbi:hypothetical protein Gasu2_56370 [Galdieria sulphuraria]|uniref:Uncharacterized protein n=1 Tax=Galdieria sulphuraria TaxID=130081 RepID=M2X979_GALSU|nr:uncharacterized protein Gasu_60310 [Galdieria sulphuraria]EME26357.1 hypothetical protein Gasu_60310 [Galdieria sulphuraria]GJD11502.1 hypothetical protein Gasu2_56370 [Galdieria sulphuraria]|eukprot:XP_005702877.1 hypothetical protein Gasu_60310 [Galdieria sulphuraria]